MIAVLNQDINAAAGNRLQVVPAGLEVGDGVVAPELERCDVVRLRRFFFRR